MTQTSSDFYINPDRSRRMLELWKTFWQDGEEIMIEGKLFVVEYLDLDYIYGEYNDTKVIRDNVYYYIATTCHRIGEYYILYGLETPSGGLVFRKMQIVENNFLDKE